MMHSRCTRRQDQGRNHKRIVASSSKNRVLIVLSTPCLYK